MPAAQRESEVEAREETQELKALREKRKRADTTRSYVMIGLAIAGILVISYAESCV